MKERPILMDSTSVDGFLKGIKTQTRRLVKIPVYHPSVPHKKPEDWRVDGLNLYDGNDELEGTLVCRQYGKPGDRLWVRESFRYLSYYPDKDQVFIEYVNGGKRIIDAFGQGWIGPAKLGRVIPSIHMPRKASRLLLEITDLRVERLQDISEDDAVAEGCVMGQDGFPELVSDPGGVGMIGFDDAVEWYAWRWEEIHGEGTWDQNPLVWAITVKMLQEGGAS